MYTPRWEDFWKPNAKMFFFALILLSASIPRFVYAQLNENCTVSILNRTAQVRPDGTWRIGNIPAGFGLVRARATCVENGITRSGQSDLFNISPNSTTGFNANIILGATTPIPQSLNVTSATNPLTLAGQTAQLTATATYAGGTTQNVTAASAGTAYNVSNPAIATVSADGRAGHGRQKWTGRGLIGKDVETDLVELLDVPVGFGEEILKILIVGIRFTGDVADRDNRL